MESRFYNGKGLYKQPCPEIRFRVTYLWKKRWRDQLDLELSRSGASLGILYRLCTATVTNHSGMAPPGISLPMLGQSPWSDDFTK